jgi:hypothetical protein
MAGGCGISHAPILKEDFKMSIQFFRDYGAKMLAQGMTLSYIAFYFGNNVYKWYNTEYRHNIKEGA